MAKSLALLAASTGHRCARSTDRQRDALSGHLPSPSVEAVAMAAKPRPRDAVVASHWSPALDRCLRAAITQGRRGIRVATDRVMAQCPALTRAQCWQRLRWLREHTNHARPARGAWPPALLEQLREGYREGGALKRAAFRAVRAHYPDLPGHVIVRVARQHGWLAKSSEHTTEAVCKRWTNADQKHFASMAEHRSVAHIARVLGRTPRAIRWRLGAQSLSAKVDDDWSLHTLERTFHVGHATLHRWIAQHDLRVRDAHITGASLRAYGARDHYDDTRVERRRALSLDINSERGYRWTEAAVLLGHRVAGVREAVARGVLKLVNTHVSDRALKAFCRQRAVERLNLARIDPAVHRWLISEYRMLPGEVN